MSKKAKLNGMIQVVLDESSSALLLEKVPAKHGTVFGHHVTVAFRPELDSPVMDVYSDGQEVELAVSGEVFDEKGQAVLVSGVETLNEFPHITVSCAEDVKPVYSNELFDTCPLRLLDEFFKLKGRVKFVSFG